MDKNYVFQLPPEEQVIERNKTITSYYAKLYINNPTLYKWAGMASFASFHIGEKLQLWNWKESGIKSFSFTCNKKNKTLEDDFQIIRIINNLIFEKIGWAHLAFEQLDYPEFHKVLLEKGKHEIILKAFKKLNIAKKKLLTRENSSHNDKLIWEANLEVLWHEQSRVVQPLFDKLSNLFSAAMTVFASFDYNINHHKTSWKAPSRFVIYMYVNGHELIKKTNYIPSFTNLEQRWFWIEQDVSKKWKKYENNQTFIKEEIKLLSKVNS